MRFQYLPIGLVTSAAATNLYVSSYSGTVTSLSLNAEVNGNYTLTQFGVNYNAGPNPSWLEKVGSVVYLADENLYGAGEINAYTTSSSGPLVQFDTHSTITGPVSLVPYNGGKSLAVAHYAGSSVTSWAIGSSGALTNLQSFKFALTKPGTVPSRQDASHPHEVIVDPTDSFVVVPDLGADVVRIFSISKSDGKLTEETPFTAPAGSGPRHGTFLKTTSATYFFLVSELANTVTSYSVTYGTNQLTLTLIASYGIHGPTNVPATVTSAEAVLSPDQNFLLTSSRMDNMFQIPNFDANNSTKIVSDTLQSWAIDHATGKLSFKQLSPAGGSIPRQFSVNKNGTLVAVGLQNDGRVVVMKRDVESGNYGDFVGAINVAGQITSVIWDE